MLAYDYWVRMGANASILGRSILVNASPVTVVGVAAKDFRGLHLGATPAIWVPLQSWRLLSSSGRNDLESPNRDWLMVVGRLGDGMTLGQAQNALATAMNSLSAEVKPVDIQRVSTPRPLQAAALASGDREAVVRFIAIVAGVVVLVLLTACANIAGLLLCARRPRTRSCFANRVGCGTRPTGAATARKRWSLAVAGGAVGVALFAAVRAALERVSLPPVASPEHRSGWCWIYA